MAQKLGPSSSANRAIPIVAAAKNFGVESPLPSALRFRRPDGSSCDEFCVDEGFAVVGLIVGEIVHPLDHAGHPSFSIDADLGNLWIEPVESRMVFESHHRDVPRDHESFAEQVLLRREK